MMKWRAAPPRPPPEADDTHMEIAVYADLACQSPPLCGQPLFYAGALGGDGPVAVQQLINNLFNMIDNLMVGSLMPAAWP